MMSSSPRQSNSSPAPGRGPAAPGSSSEQAARHQQVREVLDMIRPAVQYDGGDLELVDITADGTVMVRLHGACVGCPSSKITLKAGIERQLLDRVPGITGVEEVV